MTLKLVAFSAFIITSASCFSSNEPVLRIKLDTLNDLVTSISITPRTSDTVARKPFSLGRRFTAALLAFPLPFGIVGLHRIYLGSAPYVPVAYIATLGGAFGVLPFIDCLVLLFDPKTEKFENNKKVFMWIN